MRLAIVLMTLDMPVLAKLAKELRIAEKLPATKQAAAVLIESQYATPVGFRRIWNLLDEYERHVFGAALLEMRSDGYTHGVARTKLLQLLKQHTVPGRQPELALARLAELALLAPTQIWYLGDGYELSESIAPLVYSSVLEGLGVTLPEHVSPVVATAAVRELSRDMVRFLSHAAKTPPGVTKNGSLYKREITKLKPLLRCFELPSFRLGGQWEGVPFGVYLTVSTLQHLQVVGLLEGSFQLYGEALRDLLTSPEQTLRDTIEGAVQKSFWTGNVHLFGILRLWMATSQPGKWAPVIPELAKQYASSEKPDWVTEGATWVAVMAAAGFLEEGYHAEYGKAPLCRRPATGAAAGQRPGRWVLQPNFDLLVPEDAPLLLHFMAGQLADLVRADVMSVYRVGKHTVLRLLDRGWKPEEIEACLADFSATELPKTVLRTLRDWVREYERAVIWDAMLVRFQTPQLLTRFAADARVAQVIVETVGDAAVIVRRSGEKRVREVLADLGATPPEAVRRPGEEQRLPDGQRRTGANTKANTLALQRLTGPGVRGLLRAASQDIQEI